MRELAAEFEPQTRHDAESRSNTMNGRACLVGLLRTGAALLVVVSVLAALWVLLATVGDDSGASIARIATLIALTCWVLDFVVVVVVLAVSRLNEPQHRPKENERTQSNSGS